jgi:hypothetical protein
MTTDWYAIKFLESATNVRRLARKSTGRRPSASIAQEIAVCIQQGRLFFEAATVSPIQIKPLQIYYGVVAFARAITIARSRHSLSTLKAAHGLADTTNSNASIEKLRVCVQTAGAFQDFTDAIAPLGRIRYIDEYAMPQWYDKPFDSAGRLMGQHIELKDILARIPGLENDFAQTFSIPAKSVSISLSFTMGGVCTLRIDDPVLFNNINSLIDIIRNLRDEYPFLNRWKFTEAARAWGNSVITFKNIAMDRPDDLSTNILVETYNGISSAAAVFGTAQRLIPAEEILQPLSGGYIGSVPTYAMQPINDVMLPEYSLHFMGSFLLSSLVRYRPQIWQRAVSRSSTAQSPADDRSLSLIERFLDEVLNGFPTLVARIMDY